uniref:Uncharacterized protein n=1 Tax=Siphoviridae sp. ctQqU1 TaxID=2825496 RepID=A0A8S5Q4D4_9CAUD|nr:MAG TPA: hypothetical protein [Siphoviridae sp. ctQqU1]
MVCFMVLSSCFVVVWWCTSSVHLLLYMIKRTSQ